MMRLFLAAALVPGLASAAGFGRIEIPADTPIAAGIWYPADTAAPSEPNSPFRQALALEAPVSGEALPLVVISHGDGGWMGGHADIALALAEAGFVAVAIEHPGNNSEDESAAPAEWLVSRPRDISATIDFMLDGWSESARIDPARVGVFGFSAGGYTALVAAGARPDFVHAEAHCAATPEFACVIPVPTGAGATDLTEAVAGVAGDARVKAISIAAPGLGYAFTREGLEPVSVPVQIWSGASDDRVPHATNGGSIGDGLAQSPEVHIIPDAGHFAFIPPCNPRLKEVNPRIWDMVCVDAAGFDREGFHRELTAGVTAFFGRSFAE